MLHDRSSSTNGSGLGSVIALLLVPSRTITVSHCITLAVLQGTQTFAGMFSQANAHPKAKMKVCRIPN